jgi:pyruvate kinase
MVMRFMGKAGMVEKDERVILVEDESLNDMQEASLMKIIKA